MRRRQNEGGGVRAGFQLASGRGGTKRGGYSYSARGTEATLLSAMKQKCLQVTKQRRQQQQTNKPELWCPGWGIFFIPSFLLWAIFYMFLSSHKCWWEDMRAEWSEVCVHVNRGQKIFFGALPRTKLRRQFGYKWRRLWNLSLHFILKGKSGRRVKTLQWRGEDQTISLSSLSLLSYKHFFFIFLFFF